MVEKGAGVVKKLFPYSVVIFGEKNRQQDFHYCSLDFVKQITHPKLILKGLELPFLSCNLYFFGANQ